MPDNRFYRFFYPLLFIFTFFVSIQALAQKYSYKQGIDSLWQMTAYHFQLENDDFIVDFVQQYPKEILNDVDALIPILVITDFLNYTRTGLAQSTVKALKFLTKEELRSYLIKQINQTKINSKHDSIKVSNYLKLQEGTIARTFKEEKNSLRLLKEAKQTFVIESDSLGILLTSFYITTIDRENASWASALYHNYVAFKFISRYTNPRLKDVTIKNLVRTLVFMKLYKEAKKYLKFIDHQDESYIALIHLKNSNQQEAKKVIERYEKRGLYFFVNFELIDLLKDKARYIHLADSMINKYEYFEIEGRRKEFAFKYFEYYAYVNMAFNYSNYLFQKGEIIHAKEIFSNIDFLFLKNHMNFLLEDYNKLKLNFILIKEDKTDLFHEIKNYLIEENTLGKSTTKSFVKSIYEIEESEVYADRFKRKTIANINRLNENKNFMSNIKNIFLFSLLPIFFGFVLLAYQYKKTYEKRKDIANKNEEIVASESNLIKIQKEIAAEETLKKVLEDLRIPLEIISSEVHKNIAQSKSDLEQKKTSIINRFNISEKDIDQFLKSLHDKSIPRSQLRVLRINLKQELDFLDKNTLNSILNLNRASYAIEFFKNFRIERVKELVEEINPLVSFYDNEKAIQNSTKRYNRLLKLLALYENSNYTKERKLINASPIITEVINSTPKINLQNIKVMNEVPSNIEIHIGKGHFKDIIEILFRNAWQSMVYVGVIKIKYNQDSSYHTFEVIDQGIGISKEIEDKIYDPFFTTKEKGNGIGLGLTILLKIIEIYQGKISFHNLGLGTTFRIQIPKIK